MNTLSPLLQRVYLLPGESLPSLVARLANCNFYDSPGMVKTLCVPDSDTQGQDNMCRPLRVPTYERLATLAKIDPAELHAASAHHFASVLMPPGVEVETMAMPGNSIEPLLAGGIAAKQLRKETAAQFCPDCIKEAPYHRLIWLPVAVSACLEHKRVLATQCPKCHKPVTVREVVETRCGKCKVSLTETQLIRTGEDTLGMAAQQVIQSWMLGDPPPHDASYSLPDHPSQVLYRILDGLRISIMNVSITWKHMHSIVGGPVTLSFPRILAQQTPRPDQSYRLYATAFKGIVNWPDGFYEFLWQYRFRGKAKANGGLYGDLGTIYSQWLEDRWKHPAFQFVQEAFEQYLADRYTGSLLSIVKSDRYQNNPAMTEKFTYASFTEAAKLLHTTKAMVWRLAQMGRLDLHHSREYGPAENPAFVRRADVLELRKRWDEAITLQDAAEWLGVSDRTVLDMAQVGLLVTERGPEVDGSARWMFSKQTIGECLDRVAKNVDNPAALPKETIDLATATRMLECVGLNAGGVIKCVADGMLHCYYPKPFSTALSDLLFTEARVRTCAKKVKAGNDWVSQEDIAARMGVKRTVVAKWVKAGLLSPVAVRAGAQHFDREAIDRFVADHVFSDEVAEILDVGVDVVQKWARKGRLKPVAGPDVCGSHRYLFRREDVERLRPESRLTAPQMAKRLGISRSQLVQWIKQGKVTPLSGPWIDGSGQYLFEIPSEG